MGRQDDRLTDVDRVLWNLVARSARPLKGKAPVDEPPPIAAMQEAFTAMQPPDPVGKAPAARAPGTVTASLDRPTREKLSNGRLVIEGRVDLHGLTQAEAYALLLSFLARAYAGGIRYVLVITGKGSSSGGEGVLRRAVPAWLSTPPFRALVSSHDHAARNHGGAGALYVRLRRRISAQS